MNGLLQVSRLHLQILGKTFHFTLSAFFERRKGKEKPFWRNHLSIHKTSTVFLRKKFLTSNLFLTTDLLNNSSWLLYQGSYLVKVQFKLLLCINITFMQCKTTAMGQVESSPKQAAASRHLWVCKRLGAGAELTLLASHAGVLLFLSGVLGLPWCRMRKLLKSLRDFTSSWICCPQISSIVHSMRWSLSVLEYGRSVSCEKLNACLYSLS